MNKKKHFIWAIATIIAIVLFIVFFTFNKEPIEESKIETKKSYGNILDAKSLSDKDDKANVPELFKYEKKIIREFEWNAGIDSLHRRVPPEKIPPNLEKGLIQGPLGLLSNQNGYIYIFDYDGKVKLYSPEGVLIKTAAGGIPIGIDGKNRVYFFQSIYDSELNFIKYFTLAGKFRDYSSYCFVSCDGKLYFILRNPYDPNDNKYRIYVSDPYSTELIADEEYIKILVKHNPRKVFRTEDGTLFYSENLKENDVKKILKNKPDIVFDMGSVAPWHEISFDDAPVRVRWQMTVYGTNKGIISINAKSQELY